MYLPRPILSSVLIGGWILLGFCGDVAAETTVADRTAPRWSSRLRRPSEVVKPAVKLTGGTEKFIAAEDDPLMLDPPNAEFDDIQLEPMPMGDSIPRESAFPDDCHSCHPTYTDYEDCGPCGEPHYGAALWFSRINWRHRLRNFSLFAGVHGFKGPVDQGHNGNFGFHEGINYGAPLGDPWGMGYQLGIRGVHSNFSGDNVGEARCDDRDQVFFTGGLFHRAVCGGLQWGIAFDLLRDSYYEKSDLNQIRVEVSMVGTGCREIGFWGAFGTKNDEIDACDDEQLVTTFKQTDLYAFFYRRHFSGGGEGRFWVGFTGQRDTLFGGDIRVPLGSSWALQNSFNYLIPEEDRGAEGLGEESWSVSLQLVWYPGRSARCVRDNPSHPLFGVADNSVFMVDFQQH